MTTAINVLLEALTEVRDKRFARHLSFYDRVAYFRSTATHALEAFRAEAATPKATITMEVTQEQYELLRRAGAQLAGDKALVDKVAYELFAHEYGANEAGLIKLGWDTLRKKEMNSYRDYAITALRAVDAHLRGEPTERVIHWIPIGGRASACGLSTISAPESWVSESMGETRREVTCRACLEAAQ